jgi:cytochrome c oxidase subunit II
MHERTPFPWSRPALAAVLIALATPITSGVTAQKAELRVIEVVATRWKFEPSRIEAAVGEPLRLVVSSGDGVHGIEIKKFRVKKEIPRGGEPVTIHFTPDSPGQFPILCSEYCGDGHEDMKGMLVVAARDKDEP